MVEPRASVLLKSRSQLDLLNPDPNAWTDEDLAAGLSRTMRWSGVSRWEHPLSVAQHSLIVLAICEAERLLTPGEALRELLHDATEFMLGWDCITPLKAHLAGRPSPPRRISYAERGGPVPYPTASLSHLLRQLW
jgi:hypothetical protein